MVTVFSPPHHCTTSFGSVSALHTRSRDASNTRSTRISCRPWGTIFIASVFSCIGSSFGALEKGPEPVQPGFQHLLILFDPRRLILQTARAQLAGPYSALFRSRDEPRPFQHLHVLLDPRQGHVECQGELGDRDVPLAQALENPPTGRVGDRSESSIESCRILNHMVQYIRRTPRTQDRRNPVCFQGSSWCVRFAHISESTPSARCP